MLMCGIAGIFLKRCVFSAARLSELALTMVGRIRHRGPDDEGVWVSPDGRVALAQRRLSIIDTSSGGHQPMIGAAGRTAITYNGELYNFRELKIELEYLGRRFQSGSDTEVLLAAIELWGVGAFARFDAMFALAFYDTERRRLVLARDAFGEKPLYYVDTPDYIAFASELHALTLLPDFDDAIEPAAIAAYLSFQYVPTPHTIYRAARKLPPGSWMRIDEDGQTALQSYFAFETSREEHCGRGLDDLADELEGVLVSAVNRRLISDVPIGAFLSGGVDSSTIAAIVRRKLGAPLKTFSIGFEGHKESEHFEAEEIAGHLEAEHNARVLSADAVTLGEKIGRVLDEPNGDTSCLPTYLLSGFARESVTVALSGDGGDELFGGYGRYFDTSDEWQRKREGDCNLDGWSAGAVYLSNRVLVFPDDELKLLIGEIPSAFAAMIGGMRGEIDRDTRPLINVLRELDARTYMPCAVLPKVDRMSMQHALEVRAPLLSMDVARFAMRLGAGDCYADRQGKLVLKRVAERYLPADWMRRPKRGFGLPMDMWGRETLMPAIERLLLDDECRLAAWIEPRQIRLYIEHMRRDFHPYRAWALFILETWLRTHPGSCSVSRQTSSPEGFS